MKKKLLALLLSCTAILTGALGLSACKSNDEGKIDDPDVPLDPSTCTHETVRHEVAHAADCTDDGNLEYWYCSSCKKYFSDVELKNETTLAAVTVLSEGHKYGDLIAEQPASCTADGVVAHYHCDACGTDFDTDKKEIEDLTIPAAHKLGNWIEGKDKECEKDGVVGHYHCSECEKDFDADKNELATVVIPKGHNFGNLIPGVPATTCEDGYISHYHCDECGTDFDENKEEILPFPLGPGSIVIKATHNIQHFDAVEATCTTEGHEDYYQCLECEKYFVNEFASMETEGPMMMLGSHKFGDWVDGVDKTCTTDGVLGHYHCSECGKDYDADENELTDLVIPMGHEYGEYIKGVAPVGCVDGVIGHYHCDECGADFDENKEPYAPYPDGPESMILKAPHNIRHENAVQVTCTTNGMPEYWLCLDCGKYFSDMFASEEVDAPAEIVAEGHKLGELVPAKEPTCTEDGHKEHYHCSACDGYFDKDKNVLTDAIIPATGHDAEWVYDYTDNRYNKDCSACDWSDTQAAGSEEFPYRAKEADALKSLVALGGYIVLDADITADVVVAADTTVTLDLNGHTLTNASSHTVTNNGTLTLTGNGKVYNGTHNKSAILNNGVAVLENVTLERVYVAKTATTARNSCYVINNKAGATITLVNVKADNNGDTYSSLVCNLGTLTIESGSYTSGAMGIKNDDNGVLVINGGMFDVELGNCVQNWGSATINGGEFKDAVFSCVWSADYNVELVVNGGDIYALGLLYYEDYNPGKSPVIKVKGGVEVGEIHIVIENGTETGYGVASEVDGDYTVYTLSIPALVSNETELSAALANGGYVKLVNDITVVGANGALIQKAVTLDLNGHTISGESSATKYKVLWAYGAAAKVTVKNGKLVNKATQTPNYGAYASAGAELTLENVDVESSYCGIYVNKSKLEVTGGVIKANDFGILAYTGTENAYADIVVDGAEINVTQRGVQLKAYAQAELNNCKITTVYNADINVASDGIDIWSNATLNMNGGSIAAHRYGIVGNGADSNVRIELTNVDITSSCMGIYHPQKSSSMTINGGSITSTYTALEIRSGIVEINGATLVSTSETFSAEANKSGTTTEGVALTISQHTTNEKIVVDVNGSTLKGIYAIFEKDLMDDLQPKDITITLGDDNTYIGNIYSENCDNIANSFEVATAEELAEALASGGYVKLTADVTVEEILDVTKDTTLDLNGKTFYAATQSTEGRALNVIGEGITLTINGNGGKMVVPEEIAANSIGIITLTGADSTLNASNLTLEGGNKNRSTGLIRIRVGANIKAYLNDVNAITAYRVISSDAPNAYIEVNGGEFTLIGTGHNVAGFVVYYDSEIVLNEVTVTTEDQRISEFSDGSTAIYNNCNLTTTCTRSWYGSAVSAQFGSKVIVNGGTYKGQYAAFVFNSSGTIEINGGTFEGNFECDASKDSVTDSTIIVNETEIPFVWDTSKYSYSVGGTSDTYDCYFIKNVSTAEALTEAVKTNGTVVLMNDIAADVVIAAGKTVTIDLNGYTLTNVSGHTITNSGNLTITGNGKVLVSVDGKYAALLNNSDGVVVIENGTFERTTEVAAKYYTIENNGTMTIKDIVATNNNGNVSSLVINRNEMVIEGGEFNSGLIGVKNEGNIVINGGNFVGEASNGMPGNGFQNWGTALITGGTYRNSIICATYDNTNLGIQFKGELTIEGDVTVEGNIRLMYYTNATYIPKVVYSGNVTYADAVKEIYVNNKLDANDTAHEIVTTEEDGVTTLTIATVQAA